MLVHRHPAIAFRIGARAIELPRCLGQGDHQRIGLVLQGLRVRSALRLRQGRLRQGELRNRGNGGTIGGRGLDVGDGHHNARANQWILAQPAD
jgi:hypothetical protein